MRSHSHGGVVCEHATKKACEAARRLAMGKCVSLIEDRNDPRQCDNWAIDTVDEKGYCGQHYASVVNKTLIRKRREHREHQIQQEIAQYLQWSGFLPSVWDTLPLDWRERLPN